MPTPTQSIREIVATRHSAARIFECFDIDLCSQAENSLDFPCAELQLSVDQVLEKLANAEAEEKGGLSIDPATLSTERLIQYIVRVHHQYVRQELPRLAEMTIKLARLPLFAAYFSKVPICLTRSLLILLRSNC
jgi:regulator of cell morphogenesis and NO signaling